MHGAFAARGFAIAERTCRQALHGVIGQSPAIGAQLPVALLVAAIHVYHLPYGLFLPVYSLHVCRADVRSLA